MCGALKIRLDFISALQCKYAMNNALSRQQGLTDLFVTSSGIILLCVADENQHSNCYYEERPSNQEWETQPDITPLLQPSCIQPCIDGPTNGTSNGTEHGDSRIHRADFISADHLCCHRSCQRILPGSQSQNDNTGDCDAH